MIGSSRPCVLLVDDDPEICDFLATLLDLEGLEPLVALEAAQALALAARAEVALVDVAMPGVDGFELCRQLRASGFTAPIVLASARPGPELARQAVEAGANEFARKPFDNAELVSRLKTLIASATAR